MIPVSYDLAGAVAASGLSERTLRDAIADGSLVVHYGGKKNTKVVIRREDLDDYIASLPTERRAS